MKNEELDFISVVTLLNKEIANLSSEELCDLFNSIYLDKKIKYLGDSIFLLKKLEEK